MKKSKRILLIVLLCVLCVAWTVGLAAVLSAGCGNGCDSCNGCATEKKDNGNDDDDENWTDYY